MLQAMFMQLIINLLISLQPSLWTNLETSQISRWELCLKNKGRNSHDASEDQQIVIAVSVAGEVYAFLSDVCNFYHDVFYR